MDKLKYEERINELLNIQMENIKSEKEECSYMYDVGIYNGLELARALFIGRQPEFFDGTKIRRMNDES